MVTALAQKRIDLTHGLQGQLIHAVAPTLHRPGFKRPGPAVASHAELIPLLNAPSSGPGEQTAKQSPPRVVWTRDLGTESKHSVGHEESELTDRQREILTAIIEDFIKNAEPVGSRSLTKRKNIDVSPATVRNTMADLEQLGLLSAPHASAGRVPTPKAFRVYVERLAQRGRISTRERELIQALAAGNDQGDITGLLREAGKVLSTVSKHATLVLMPSLDDVRFAHIEFMPIRERSVLAVFVAKSGIIQHRVIDTDLPLDRDELTHMSNYLNAHLHGKTLTEVRVELVRAMANERSQADHMMRQALILGERMVGDPSPQSVVLEGERAFLDHPEFADIEKMRRLLRAFEEKTILVRLLDLAVHQPIDAQAANGADTTVVLGVESSMKDLKELAAVTAAYTSEGEMAGRVGVLGPTRMDYARVIPLVEMTADALSQSLSPRHPDDDPEE